MRIGILTDIHEDIVSLKEALTLFEKNNCDKIICLGDMVGFDKSFYKFDTTKNASSVLEIVEKNCMYAVLGNHDLFALQKLPKHNSVYKFATDWYKTPFDIRKAKYGNDIWLYESEEPANLTSQAYEYLDSLTEFVIAEFDKTRLFISHALHPDLTGSVQVRFHNPWELRDHTSVLVENKCSYGFSGHMHPSGLLSGTTKQIYLYPFGEYHIVDELMQFSCPALVNGKSKSGITIIDLKENYIETLRLKTKNNFFVSLYERIIK